MLEAKADVATDNGGEIFPVPPSRHEGDVEV
jgi:hypothetical protein